MRILLADDHALVREGVALQISFNNPEIEVVQADSFTDAFAKAASAKFDLALFDLNMPGGPWHKAVVEFAELHPDVPFAIMSATDDANLMRETISNGARGYIPKTTPPKVMLSAVDIMLSGEMFVPREAMPGRKAKKNEPESNLTRRQRDVLRLMAEGKSNKQIAYELNLVEGTVKLHITAILKELNANNRTMAVVEAQRLGLVSRSEMPELSTSAPSGDSGGPAAKM